MSWHGTAWITTIQDNKYGRDGQQQRVGDTKRHHHPGVHTNLPKIVPCIAQHNTQNSTIRQTQHRHKNRRIHIIDVSQETINRPISLLISIRCILYCIISVLPVECARTIMPINKMECRRVQCAQMYYTITRAHTTFPFSVCVYCFDISVVVVVGSFCRLNEMNGCGMCVRSTMFRRDDSISIRQKALRIAVCVLCHTASPSPHTNSVNQKGGRVYIRRGHGFLIVISRLLERVSLRNACIQPGRQCLRWCVHDLFIFLWFCFSLLCSFALTANARLLFMKKKNPCKANL